MTKRLAATGPATVTLCIRNLASETTPAEVAELFSVYGDVQGVRLCEDKFQRRFQRVCYIDLLSDMAERALVGLDGHLFKGAIIELTECAEDTLEDDRSAVPLTGISEYDARPGRLAREPYTLVSVEKVAMDASKDGSHWFRYILQSGPATIVGYHQGNLEDVMGFAEGCADKFNLRNRAGWKSAYGRVPKS